MTFFPFFLLLFLLPPFDEEQQRRHVIVNNRSAHWANLSFPILISAARISEIQARAKNIFRAQRSTGMDDFAAKSLYARKLQFSAVAVTLAIVLFNLCPDTDTWCIVLALCFPGFPILYNIHVQHFNSGSWWANWAVHKLLSLVLVLVFACRLVYGGTQRHDLIGLGLWLYLYHACGDVEL